MRIISDMFQGVYRNRKVLVTGHTGFKGSWLTIWLKELGAEVVGYSLDPPTEPSNFAACALPDKITHIHGDVRDLDHLTAVFNRCKPEFVFHLAAQPLVRRSYAEPKLTFDTNVGGTVNVLEAVRLTPDVRVVIAVTSDKCYENKEFVWGYRENDPMGGDDPYSASKGCSELVFASYLKSYFDPARGGKAIGAASARAGNVIGGGDWGQDRLIPDAVRALTSNRPIVIRSPRAVRPWQHVLEPLSGYLRLGALLWRDPGHYRGSWNFGPGSEAGNLTVSEIAARFIELWGSGTIVEASSTEPSLHEMQALKLCCDKANALLGWRSAFQIDECLRYTVDWYKRFYSGCAAEQAYAACCEQIGQYVLRASGRAPGRTETESPTK